MSPQPASERLTASWVDNAHAWTDAVRAGAIPSRRAGTDGAILDAIAQAPAGSLIDVGCGEGWLVRAAAASGRDVLGVDASAPLVEAARLADPHTRARYERASYAELVNSAERLGAPFRVAVFNFALLDDTLADSLMAVRSLLAHDGVLLIQTVHPFTACGGAAYQNAWREEAFDAFGGRFPSHMPWYFHTMASWFAALHDAGFSVDSVTEPMAVQGSMPLSLLLRARPLSDQRA